MVSDTRIQVKRRYLIASVPPLLAGCGSRAEPESSPSPPATDPTPTGTDTPRKEDRTYVIFTEIPDEVPADAPIVKLSESGLTADSRVRALVEGTMRSSAVTKSVDYGQYESIQAELSDMPKYTGDKFGYYFSQDDEVVRLYIAVQG